MLKRMLTRVSAGVLLSIIQLACSTPGTRPNLVNFDRPDVVISRSDNLSERPSWLQESEAFKIEGGNVVSLGSNTIPGDSRIESAFRVAENNAKSGIAAGVQSKLEFIFQNAEEGSTAGQDQTRFIGSEVSSLVSSSIRPHRRYWERYSTVNESGQQIIRYRVFATVIMPETDFKQAVLAAIRKREGSGGISKDFAGKVDQQWDRLVERSPSSDGR